MTFLPPPLKRPLKAIPLQPFEEIQQFPVREKVVQPDRKARRALEELVRRQMEGMALYTALPKADEFHRSQAATRLAIGSNRSSKTHTAACEMVYALTGTHPYRNYPKSSGKFYCVAFDSLKIGEVMWPKLAHPGAFKIIPDEITGKWRPVLPDQEYDAAYREKWRDAAPLLPERCIKEIAWGIKNKDVPEIVETTNGNTARFFSSKGSPMSGSAIDGWWFDEEVENRRWLPEMQARVVTRSGCGWWSCTPEHSTEELFLLHQRATSLTGKYNVESFLFTIDDNIYVSKAQKEEFYNSLLSEQERRVKYHGNFLLSARAVYPEYSRQSHLVKSFLPPEEWARYMVVDPGVQVCAVLFCAVPDPKSPHFGEYHIYDELYIQRCSAARFAEEVEKKMGHRKSGGFTAFLIDNQMGRQSEIGTGRTVISQYSEALEEKEIWSYETGNSFIPGSPDIASREEALRRWLEDNPMLGRPTVKIHDRCRYLDWEMEKQFYKKGPNGEPTNKRMGKDDHAVSCLEYFADFEPVWVSPKNAERENPILKFIKKGKKDQSKAVRLGPK